MNKVIIVKCIKYHDTKKSIEKVFNFMGGLNSIIGTANTVLLKPNMIDPLPPEKAATTHPLFVKAVAELIKETGAEVWIGDACGGVDSLICDKVFEISGISKVAKGLKIKLINFHRDEKIKIDIPEGNLLKKVEVAKSVLDADIIINLPKLKTHGLTFYTGAVKNIFGCLPGEWKENIHKMFPKREDFCQALVDVYSAIKPNLTIMDAVIGMEGDGGPSYGDPRKIGLILASQNGIALDAIACEIIGYSSLAIPTTRFAHERKLGQGDIKKIEIIGENLKKVKISDFKKSSLFPTQNIYKKQDGFGNKFLFEPEVDESECIKCGNCVQNCPVSSIELSPYPVFNREKCIHCYCCQELCAEGAIKLKKVWLSDMYAPYIKKNEKTILITSDKNIEIEMVDIKPKNLFKLELKKGSKLFLLSFQLNKQELNTQTGQKILDFLIKLKKEKINFRLTKPLPRCLLGFNYRLLDDFNIPKSCFDCIELFSIQNEMAIGCNVLNNRIGPKLVYMKNRNQIYEYFNSFHRELKVSDKCKSCIYFVRKECNGLCFRNNY